MPELPADEWVCAGSPGDYQFIQYGALTTDTEGEFFALNQLIAPLPRTAEDREKWIEKNKIETRWNCTIAGEQFVELSYEHTVTPIVGEDVMFTCTVDAVNYAMDMEELRGKR